MMNPYFVDPNNIKKISENFEHLHKLVDELKFNNEEILKIDHQIAEVSSQDDEVIKILGSLLRMHSALIDTLDQISKKNLNDFLFIQNLLFERFRNQIKYKIKTKYAENFDKFGKNLILNKELSKVKFDISFIYALPYNLWIEIIESLNQNNAFLKYVSRLESKYERIKEERLQRELKKIPEEFDQSVKKEFIKQFLEDPTLTGANFIDKLHKRQVNQNLKIRELSLDKARERSELERLKIKQEEQKTTYDEYLKLSIEEFEMRRRKKTRKKISDIKRTPGDHENIELTDAISEKIKKFKTELDKKYDNYYVKGDQADKDPKDLVRERKKRKQEEYKEYKKHFE